MHCVTLAGGEKDSSENIEGGREERRESRVRTGFLMSDGLS